MINGELFKRVIESFCRINYPPNKLTNYISSSNFNSYYALIIIIYQII